MFYRKRTACFIFILALSACSNHSKAPVKSLSSEKARLAAVAYNQYRVKPGDTLYSIAFRYGLNYQNLASNNKIPAPYRIKPGQTIVLNDDYVPYQEVIQPQTDNRVAVIKPQAKEPVTQKPKSGTPSTKKPNSKTPSVATKKPSSKPTKKPTETSQYDGRRKVQKWYWPIATSRKYTRTGENQFIFQVPSGTAVRAVAAGRVVYSGKGLVGYGNLVIIKHSDSLLSAYAYNDKVMVKEKQEIKAGQKISTVGKSPTGEIGLGFEIRRRGKPIDARKFLPK